MTRAGLMCLASLSIMLSACTPTQTESVQGPDAPSVPSIPPGTQIVRETLTGTISAASSAACSEAFRSSVDASYFLGGTKRCVEFSRRSLTAGIITARLTWQESRLDLDLVLNDGVAMNYRQSIAANRCCETVEFFVNGGTNYVFVVYLRGVDPQFIANGGTYTGDVSTPFTLVVERPL